MAVHLAAFGSLAVWCLCVPTAWSGEVHDAARTGDLPRLNALLADDPHSAHACDSKGRTPLHWAAYFGRSEAIDLLLAAGDDRTTRDRQGTRPAEAAARRGHLDLVPRLVQFEVVPLAPRVRRITPAFRTEVNTTVQTGPDGVLVVDTGEGLLAGKLKEAIDALGAGSIALVINTHEHAVHTGGNDVLGAKARILRQSNLQKWVEKGVLAVGTEPLVGRTGRRFDEHYILRHNGEEVRLIPTPGAHSDSDLIVHFTSSDVAALGDLLDSQSFPPCGAGVQRYLALLETTIDVLPLGTTLVAGHGRDSTLEDARQYHAMLLETIAVVRHELRAGKTVAQMQQERILRAWDSWGEFIPNLNADYWIATVSASYAGAEQAAVQP